MLTLEAGTVRKGPTPGPRHGPKPGAPARDQVCPPPRASSPVWRAAPWGSHGHAGPPAPFTQGSRLSLNISFPIFALMGKRDRDSSVPSGPRASLRPSHKMGWKELCALHWAAEGRGRSRKCKCISVLSSVEGRSFVAIGVLGEGTIDRLPAQRVC